MKRYFWMLGILAVLLVGSCQDRSFGRVGPPITIPPPVEEPEFLLGADPQTVVVKGTAFLPNEARPGARVSLLNLDVGRGVVVVTGLDGLYEETIPGDAGDLIEITVEFEEEFFRAVFPVVLP